MGERYQLDVILTESYRDMQPLCFRDWAFYRHMIYLAIVVSSQPFPLKTQVGAFGDCVDDSESWEIGALLGRLLVLWWRLGWVIWFSWLGVCYGICYLQGCGRVGDG
jgi:hypothetical protein